MKWKGVGIEADKTKLTLMIILKRMTTWEENIDLPCFLIEMFLEKIEQK